MKIDKIVWILWCLPIRSNTSVLIVPDSYDKILAVSYLSMINIYIYVYIIISIIIII